MILFFICLKGVMLNSYTELFSTVIFILSGTMCLQLAHKYY